jgi:hypothetical protein
MKDVKFFFVCIATAWLAMLLSTAIVLLAKMLRYLWDNPFHEWHLMILWALSVPITILVLGLAKIYKEKVK